MIVKEFKDIIECLRDIIYGTEWENHVYGVGGCVRDLLMEHPIKDIDLVIDLPDGGINFANWVKEHGYTNGSVVTYPTYGTAMFRLAKYPDIELECVQTRGEQYHDKNSRNPEVVFANIEDDAFRRDLTINALYLSVSTGQIIDVTKMGEDDIKNHVIRTTNSNPDVVFIDDPLRIMRVCRFSCRYSWKIEKETYMSMMRNVDRLEIITKERIQDELLKILCCDNPVMGLEELEDIGALKYIIPELQETVGMTQNKYHFGDVWEHTLKVVDNVKEMVKTNTLFPKNGYTHQVLMVAALLHDIGKINTRTEKDGNVHFIYHELESEKLAIKILKRLKFSNDFIDDVAFAVKEHMRFKSFGDNTPTDKALRKFQYACKTLSRFELCLILIHADNMAHAEKYCLPNQYDKIMKRSFDMIGEGEAMFGYKLPIDGNDIMEFKKIEPGPDVKKYQEYLLKMAYNGVGKLDRETCFKYIKNIDPQKI